MTRLIVSAASMLVAVMLPVAASAQAPANEGGGRGRMAACRADAAQLCANAEAGRGRRLACLVENKAKLSADCAQAVEAREAERAAKGGRGNGRRADKAEEPGAGPSASGPSAAPGPAANAGEEQQRGRGRGRMAACKGDREALCATVQRGGGRMMQCLRDNREKLSAACGEALSAMPERRGRGKRADAGEGVTAVR